MSNNLLKKIINKLTNHKITSEEYISILQRRGIRVGEQGYFILTQPQSITESSYA